MKFFSEHSAVVISFCVVVFFCVLPVYGQPGDPGGGQDPDVPISGIEWLVGAGGLLGSRYLWKKVKKL
ncbi:MAG: hypothetical protein ACOYXA_18980 [Bacteroidota bacterium]